MSNKRDDTKLIRSCIEFARDIRAAEARFNAIPESFTDPLVHEAEEKKFRRGADLAARRLAKIVRTRASTFAGLCAKARIASVVSECCVEEKKAYDAEESLLESLSADVLALLGEERTEPGASAVLMRDNDQIVRSRFRGARQNSRVTHAFSHRGRAPEKQVMTPPSSH
jgi:hypothetical protein